MCGSVNKEVRAPEARVRAAIEALVTDRRLAAERGWSDEKLEEILTNDSLIAADVLVTGGIERILHRTAAGIRDDLSVRLREDSLTAFSPPGPDGPDGDRAAAPEAADADGDIPQEEIDRAVGAVLRQYRCNAGTLGAAPPRQPSPGLAARP